ncbi:hypothetical protein Anas_05568 [Armadillidium nasatum]|uniref:Uncharacterized protein n=1 Tax=Armadillidium nasatum TaxID=96803 RepID=A0A5N5TMD6_9CRUS|nr:hypothetical protein Anas_05568 [Armadillidium nasatum]
MNLQFNFRNQKILMLSHHVSFVTLILMELMKLSWERMDRLF